MFGPGRNLHAYIARMTKLKAISDRFDTVYPSHGPIPISSNILNGLMIGVTKVLNNEIEGKKSNVVTFLLRCMM